MLEWRYGFLFNRCEDGSIQILHRQEIGTDYIIIAHIPAIDWVDIISKLGEGKDDKTKYQIALSLHYGKK